MANGNEPTNLEALKELARSRKTKIFPDMKKEFGVKTLPNQTPDLIKRIKQAAEEEARKREGTYGKVLPR